MQKIFIVGTSHQKITPKYKKDLIRAIKSINPDQLMIEKLPIEVTTGKFYPDRPEMKVAYDWAIKNNRKVTAYDHRSNIVDRRVSKDKQAQVNDQLTSYTLRYGWKEINQSEHLKNIKKIIWPIIDQQKFYGREVRMQRALKRKMIGDGRILILTGNIHIIAFKKTFYNAQLLY